MKMVEMLLLDVLAMLVAFLLSIPTAVFIALTVLLPAIFTGTVTVEMLKFHFVVGFIISFAPIWLYLKYEITKLEVEKWGR